MIGSTREILPPWDNAPPDGYHPGMLLIQLYRGGTQVREIRTAEPMLTIGRDAGCSIALDDPEKLISRQHATIETRDGVPYFIVHSRVNPVLVDGRVMRTGQSVVLADGARITVSPYELVVSKAGTGPQAAVTMDAVPVPPEPPPRAVAPAPAPLPAIDPMAEVLPSDDPITETTTPWRRSADGGLEQATQAFLRGVGLAHLKIPPDEQAFFLERAGVMMQCVVEALVPMLVARSRLREGLDLAETQPGNPLAGLTSPAEAMALLVDPARQQPGSMDAMQALQESAAALCAHQEALMAGTRAALPALLQALAPDVFDAAAAQAAGPLGINRRSRAWEAFVDAHATLARQAAGDPDAILRGAFRQAYLDRVSGRGD